MAVIINTVEVVVEQAPAGAVPGGSAPEQPPPSATPFPPPKDVRDVLLHQARLAARVFAH